MDEYAVCARNNARELDRLCDFACSLSEGGVNNVQKLRPIRKLISSFYSRGFYLFLVESSYDLFKQGRSLASERLISNQTKQELYQSAICGLNALKDRHEGMLIYGKELIDIYQYCQELSPGNYKSAGRDRRRKLSDPDLVLIEQTVRFSVNHWYGSDWAYWLTRYYCCDYKNYRFKPDERSLERLVYLIRYLSTTLPIHEINVRSFQLKTETLLTKTGISL